MRQLEIFDSSAEVPSHERPRDCFIKPVGKRRDGGTRYWCLAHKADATAKYGLPLKACRVAHLPPISNSDVFDLNLDRYAGGVGLWGAVPPVYDTTRFPLDLGVHVHARIDFEGKKEIDATYHAVSLFGHQLPKEGLMISGIDAVYYMVSSVFGFDMRYVQCGYCGYSHLDKDWFSVHPHRRHLCAGCGRSFYDSVVGIGNPIRAAQELLGFTPSNPVRASKVISLRQDDYPGGIQIWGSNPAIVWSSDKAEEEGIHLHAYKSDADIADPDDTFSAVEIDGVRLDPTMVRTLMAQNAMPHLNGRVVSLRCEFCGDMEFSCGEQAYTPTAIRVCVKCKGDLKSKTRYRRIIGNPLKGALEELSARAPRPPQNHATFLLPEAP